MASLSLTDRYFEMYKTLVYEESGICFNSINRVVLEARINNNIKAKKLLSYDDYYALLKKDKDELKQFLDSVTTNLTKFFRNETHFEALQKYVFPEIAARKGAQGTRALTIWSAGCSTGEEPYSLAIEALESSVLKDWNVRVYASDLSLRSLVAAKEGRYAKEKLEKVRKDIILRYFDSVADEYVVKKTLKNAVTFDYHNLKHRSPLSGIDIIFCRNVIIYFDADSQKQAIDRFYDALNPDGYLFLGHSESLFGMETNFKFNNAHNAIVYTKGAIRL